MTTRNLRLCLIVACVASGCVVTLGGALAKIVGMAFPLIIVLCCAAFCFSLAALLHFDGADDKWGE